MTIYYWDGAVGRAHLIEKHREHIQLILDGHYQEVGLEKLHGVHLNGFPVYSSRLNKSDRLLFSTIRINGKNRFLLIDEDLKHKYELSTKEEKLKSFFNTNIEAIKNAASEKTDDIPSFAPTNIKEPIAVKAYNKQFIVLNTKQNEALKTPLPLLVSGTAGSGKSCIAMMLLEQLAHKRPEDVLYVSSSPELVNNMQRIWQAQSGSAPVNVKFKTYEQLLKEMDPEACAGKEFVGKEKFIDWFKTHISANTTIRKGKREEKSQLTFEKVEEAYQEFRIICAIKKTKENRENEKKEYLALGSNQSLFSDIELRDQLWRAYGIYEAVLEDKKQIDVSFKKIHHKNKFAAIVVDEAQDFSNLQLDQISHLAINNQVCYCMDTNQRSGDILSTRSALLRTQSPTHIELPYTYRCAPKVATVASQVLAAKTYLTGGTADRYEGAAMQTSAEASDYGIIEWINPSEQQDDELKRLARSHQVAIVVSSLSAIQNTKDKFQTDLVFTPETIKGLEYPTIILCGMLDDDVFKQASKDIGPNKIKSNPNRVKLNPDMVKYALPFNRVFTAITRAQQRLIVYQAETKIGNLVRELKEVFTPNLEAATTAPGPSSREEWLAEADRLEAEGKVEIANQIRKRYAPTEEVVTPLLPPPAIAKMELSRKNKKDKKTQTEETPTNKRIILTFPLNRRDLETVFLRSDYLHQLFCVVYPNGKNLFENILLSKTLNDRSILEYFLNSKTTLLKSLFNKKTFNEPITLENNTQWWLFATLVSGEGGMHFLSFLSEHKKFDLGKELIPATLAFCVNLVNHKNMSIFFHLSSCNPGIDILTKLIESNPLLISQLPPSVFFNLVIDPEGKLAPSSPIINLLASKRLKNLASTIFILNQSLMVLPKTYHTEGLVKAVIWSLLTDLQSFRILILFMKDQDFAAAIPEHILLNTIPDVGVSAFFTMCTQFPDQIKDFLAKLYLANTELCIKLTWTALDMACIQRLSPLVHDMLKIKVDFDPNQLPNGIQPLARAAMQGADNVMETLLQDPRINPNICTPYGATPLYLAVSKEKENIVKTLIKHKADVNLPGPNNTTPLMVAVDKGNKEIVNRLLFSSNANPNLRNNKNEDAFMMAFRNGNPEIILLFILSNRMDPDYKLTTTINQCLKVANVAGQKEALKEFIMAKIADDNDSITLTLSDIEILIGHTGLVDLGPRIEGIMKALTLQEASKLGITFIPQPPQKPAAQPKNEDAPSPK